MAPTHELRLYRGNRVVLTLISSVEELYEQMLRLADNPAYDAWELVYREPKPGTGGITSDCMDSAIYKERNVPWT